MVWFLKYEGWERLIHPKRNDFNIIGDSWNTTIKRVEYSIQMPKEFDTSKVFFYLPTQRNSNYYTIKDNTINGRYFSKLYPKQALTIKINLPDKYFIEPPITFNVHMLLFIIPLLVLIISATLWFIYGRDNKTIEVVSYKPPEDLNPVEMAYIYSQGISPDAISSLIFYLASKGYIRISPDAGYDSNSIFSNVNMKNIKFELVKPYDGNNPIENLLISTMFAAKSKISIYEMATNISLSLLPDKIKKEMDKGSILFVKSSLVLQRFVYLLMILSFILCCGLFCYFINLFPIIIHLIVFPLAGYILFIRPLIKNIILGIKFNPFVSFFGFIWCGFSFTILGLFTVTAAKSSGVLPTALYFAFGVVLIILTEIFAIHMTRWTYKGNSVYGRILGFRSFLKRVKLREMKYRVNKEPQYFYNILPFAFVLGLSDKWMEKFMPIMEIAPAYYDDINFNSKDYTRTLSSIRTLSSVCFTSHNNSSHGGCSRGGGSSGGGGGGGGGGSW